MVGIVRLFLYKCLDAGCHTAKCLGSNSEELFSHHTWECKHTVVRFLYCYIKWHPSKHFFQTLLFIQCCLPFLALFCWKIFLRFLSPELCVFLNASQSILRLMGSKCKIFYLDQGHILIAMLCKDLVACDAYDDFEQPSPSVFMFFQLSCKKEKVNKKPTSIIHQRPYLLSTLNVDILFFLSSLSNT